MAPKKKAATSLSVDSVEKKVKTKPVVAEVQVKKEAPMISVEVRVWKDRDDSDYEEFDIPEEDVVYVDVKNTRMGEETEGLLPYVLTFNQLGCGGDYPCCRKGTARVKMNGSVIGTINYTLINRDELGGGGVDFCEVCDAESAELELVASLFFKPRGYGELTKKFCKAMVDNEDEISMPNLGVFVYINSIKMDEPYGRDCAEENVTVAATALDLFFSSSAFFADELTATLAMYIPDGLANDSYHPRLLGQDMRAFKKAGFGTARVKGSDVPFMFKELAHTFSVDCNL